MKGIKYLVAVIALLLITAGFISCREVKTGNSPKVEVETLSKKLPFAPIIKDSFIFFPGGGRGSFEIDRETGCISGFFNKDSKPIEGDATPIWLTKGKTIYDIRSFNNSPCSQGLISIQGSPIEYDGVRNGKAFCFGAWDPECGTNGHWYDKCVKEGEEYRCPH